MFWQNYVRLCNERGLYPNSVAKEIGIKSSGTVTSWKNGAIPRAGVLARLADYFGVTEEELLMDKSAKKPVKPAELPINIIARAGKNMTIEDQELLLKFAKFTFPEAFKDE